MKGISQVDGIFGQKTSQWAFPQTYVEDKAKGEKKLVGLANQVDRQKLTQMLTQK